MAAEWRPSKGEEEGGLVQCFEDRFRHIGETILQYCSWRTVKALKEALAYHGRWNYHPQFIFNKSAWWYQRFIKHLQLKRLSPKGNKSHEMWSLVVEAVTESQNASLEDHLIAIFCKELHLLSPPNVADICLFRDKHPQLKYECYVYLHLIDWPIQCMLRHSEHGSIIITHMAKTLLWSDMLLFFQYYAYESPLHCLSRREGQTHLFITLLPYFTENDRANYIDQSVLDVLFSNDTTDLLLLFFSDFRDDLTVPPHAQELLRLQKPLLI